ncbi:MAG: hypothetical protein FIB06_04015 [Betaproteobacteria bacterium]|nr:hypothetical protein [Betaproteobacteria bacterium]
MEVYVTPTDPLVAEWVESLDSQLRETFEERAAILQFDSELARAHAECLALVDLLRRHPSVLSGVSVLEIELDGGTEWLLTTDLTYARRYVAEVGAHEVALHHLPDVLLTQYGGIAVLNTLG